MNRQLLILASAPFGHAVAGRIRDAVPETQIQRVDEGTHASLWPHADLIILAGGQERPLIADAIDQAAHAWGVPWFPVHSSAGEIQCGPVIVPGHTACYFCFTRRREQHGGQRPGEAQRRIPGGYPEHHVGIAAALARQAIAEVFAEVFVEAFENSGQVRLFGQVDGVTRTAGVIAVDRCRRCRPTEARDDDLWDRFKEVAL